MRKTTALLVLAFLLCTSVHAQIYGGFNAGPILFRTGDVQFFVHPKNADWMAVHFGGGATLKSPFILQSRKDCISKWRNNGYHFRAGFRNGLTKDHHKSHLFWGLNLIYSRIGEFGVTDSCNTEGPGIDLENKLNVLSGALIGGYSWNPIYKKMVHQKFLVDFGMQIGFPLWKSGEFLGRRQYVSGIGLGGLPIRSVHLELVAIFRWELYHNRFGYKKAKTIKH